MNINRLPKPEPLDSDEVKELFFDLLGKLGVRSSPRLGMSGMTSKQFERLIAQAAANFGMPDKLMIDEATLEAYNNLFLSKK